MLAVVGPRLLLPVRAHVDLVAVAAALAACDARPERRDWVSSGSPFTCGKEATMTHQVAPLIFVTAS
jgi:hypothetical protein